MDFTAHWLGLAALGVFAAGYAVVVAEERLGVPKSVPVLVSAGLVWLLVGVAYTGAGRADEVAELARHNLLDYGELLLFLLVAMTYVNTMEERGVFDLVRRRLVGLGLSLRALFWVTGALAFLLSPVADNLTTALVMGAVVAALGRDSPRFVVPACVSVVVAANAGGVFSPFGDVTTLMVWQKGHVPFEGFFPLVLPALVNWLVPAGLMSLAIGPGRPEPVAEEGGAQPGGLPVAVLFLLTIGLTVVSHSALHLPPAVGMMFGLGLLKLYSVRFNRRLGGHPQDPDEFDDTFARPALRPEHDHAPPVGTAGGATGGTKPILTFRLMERVEWDTLMFFYGVVLGVGGLGALGYLGVLSRLGYDGLGPTAANVLVGLLSAVVDNVPVMFAVLSMDPPLSRGQWLLVTLTAGVGGSLLSVGSAAGVALMGQARGVYTFLAHLRWSWAVALGYAASILTHWFLNRHLF